MNEVLTVNVNITQINEVKGHKGSARMILFDGDVCCDNFKGVILPGGVDTQKDISKEETLLSARYILEGKDIEGKDCRIFIENNGTIKKGEEMTAIPKMLTDSEALSFLETQELFSKIEGKQGGVIIHIFTT